MSIEIIYGRQFLRTTRGIIPLFLAGSSNCTMFYGGREIRERYWSGFFFDTGVEITEADILENIEHYRNKHEDADREICRINGKNVCGEDVYRYICNGIKNAKDIETVFELSRHMLECSVSFAVKNDDSYWGYDSLNEMRESFKTTQALEDWLDKAHKRIAEIKTTLPGVTWCFIRMDFGTIKPLGIDKASINVEGPIIVKISGKGYVQLYTESSIITTRDISKALVFDSAASAKSMLPQFYTMEYQFVKASAIQRNALKKWVLKIEEGSKSGYFIKKLNARSLAFCYRAIDAKRFVSEDDAISWFNTKIMGRFPGCVSASVQKITDAT